MTTCGIPTPIGEFVLLEMEEVSVTAGGIHLPSRYRDGELSVGTVRGTGPGLGTPDAPPVTVQIGNKVLFFVEATVKWTDPETSKEYRFIRASQIVAIL